MFPLFGKHIHSQPLKFEKITKPCHMRFVQHSPRISSLRGQGVVFSRHTQKYFAELWIDFHHFITTTFLYIHFLQSSEYLVTWKTIYNE